MKTCLATMEVMIMNQRWGAETWNLVSCEGILMFSFISLGGGWAYYSVSFHVIWWGPKPLVVAVIHNSKLDQTRHRNQTKQDRLKSCTFHLVNSHLPHTIPLPAVWTCSTCRSCCMAWHKARVSCSQCILQHKFCYGGGARGRSSISTDCRILHNILTMIYTRKLW